MLTYYVNFDPDADMLVFKQNYNISAIRLNRTVLAVIS